jgi:hypothetical protein
MHPSTPPLPLQCFCFICDCLASDCEHWGDGELRAAAWALCWVLPSVASSSLYGWQHAGSLLSLQSLPCAAGTSYTDHCNAHGDSNFYCGLKRRNREAVVAAEAAEAAAAMEEANFHEDIVSLGLAFMGQLGGGAASDKKPGKGRLPMPPPACLLKPIPDPEKDPFLMLLVRWGAEPRAGYSLEPMRWPRRRTCLHHVDGSASLPGPLLSLAHATPPAPLPAGAHRAPRLFAGRPHFCIAAQAAGAHGLLLAG